MKSTLAKSVFVGLAALSVASVAQVGNASAKTKKSAVKTTYNKVLTTDAATRNVAVTGKNAIFSYPKTVKKSARTVAKKATVAQLASSKKSADYFRAYRVLKTSKGSIYYKVVSFNGKYRGYVYGGKSANKFAAGVQSAQTTTAVPLTSAETSQSYYFANPGTTNVTWNEPKGTQYKTNTKKMITDTTPYKNDALVVTGAKKKTREGSLYYQVTDAQYPKLNGWVYAKALTNEAPASKNVVKINYKTADGQVVKTSSYAPAASVKVGDVVTSDVKGFVAKNEGTTLSGTGYSYTESDTYNTNVFANPVKAGDSINLIVVKNDNTTSKVDFTLSGTATVAPKTLAAKDFKDGYPSITNADQSSLAGTKDTAFSLTNFESGLAASGKQLNTLTGTSTVSKDKKTTTTTVYTYDKATTDQVNANAKYGETIHLYYTAKQTTKDVPATTPAPTTDANTAYVAK